MLSNVRDNLQRIHSLADQLQLTAYGWSGIPDHGLKNNTRLTRFCDPTKKKSIR